MVAPKPNEEAIRYCGYSKTTVEAKVYKLVQGRNIKPEKEGIG